MLKPQTPGFTRTWAKECRHRGEIKIRDSTVCGRGYEPPRLQSRLIWVLPGMTWMSRLISLRLVLVRCKMRTITALTLLFTIIVSVCGVITSKQYLALHRCLLSLLVYYYWYSHHYRCLYEFFSRGGKRKENGIVPRGCVCLLALLYFR